jgi:enediyne core biosynthesis thioesterase
MHLAELVQSRIALGFAYWRQGEAGEELVARGAQEVACMRREAARLVATPVPEALTRALLPYAESRSE